MSRYDEHEPVHHFFGLSYANYLVLHRTILQSMPLEWQRRFVDCLAELQDAAFDLDIPDRWAVMPRGEGGRFTTDPIPHYDRGRTRIALSTYDSESA